MATTNHSTEYTEYKLVVVGSGAAEKSGMVIQFVEVRVCIMHDLQYHFILYLFYQEYIKKGEY